MESQMRERICINVEKVYDWIVKELTFDFHKSGDITFPGLPHMENLHDACVTCKVMPDKYHPIVILSRENRTFSIEGRTVCLQQLNIKKNFDITIVLTLKNGHMYESTPIEVSRCEQVILCAPKGTDVEITYTDLDCFVCSTGHISQTGNPIDHKVHFPDLSITVSVCQSIQSTFPVTVEFLADYCEPRADFPFACSPTSRPRQCSAIFPSGE